MDGMCAKCQSRDQCVDLCPEAEAYANQDNVPQQHLSLPDVKYSNGKKLADYSNGPLLHADLSERQWEIVRYIALGKTNKEIAKLMNVKESTVRSQRQRIREKMSL